MTETYRVADYVADFISDADIKHVFLLPGGGSAGAALHVARGVCRRAERRIIALGVDAVPVSILRYVNRLSDLLFVLARTANRRCDTQEREW